MTRLTTYANGDAEPTTTDDPPSEESQHGTEPGDSGTVRFEVFARGSVPPDVARRQRAFVARLRDRVATAPTVELVVETWPKQVSAPSADALEVQSVSSTARDRYAAFERWAAERVADLDPAFRERDRVSLSGDARSVVVDLPVLCVAVYEAGEIRTVFPHSVDGEIRLVEEAFAALDAHTELSRDAPAVDAEPSVET